MLPVNYIGRQNSSIVPQGISNHNDNNFVALTIWSLYPAGARLDGLKFQENDAS